MLLQAAVTLTKQKPRSTALALQQVTTERTAGIVAAQAARAFAATACRAASAAISATQALQSPAAAADNGSAQRDAQSFRSR